LQVGIVATQSSRYRNGLCIRSVNPTGFRIDQLRKRIDIGILQFGEFAEREDIVADLVLVGQFGEHVFPGGVLSGFRFLRLGIEL